MLAYLLALMVAVGSLVFYLAAFFLPEIHRRQDFIWSGVGLFYALVLWSCAGRITGAVLLGQMASVALLGGLAWQTLALRRAMTPVTVRTAATWQGAQQWLDDTWNQLQRYFQGQSLTAALGAIAQDIQRASGSLRQRIAGPRGKPKRAVIDIPPRAPSIPRVQPPGPEASTENRPKVVTPADVATPAIDIEGEMQDASVAANRGDSDALGVSPRQSARDSLSKQDSVIGTTDVSEPATVSDSTGSASEASGDKAQRPALLDEVTNWDDE